jgi:hypothetical protein
MTLRRFSHETQRNYLRDAGRFATWLGRSPHTATAEDVRRFQIEQQEAGVPAPTMNSIVAAPRFFFTHALDRPDLARKRRSHRRGASRISGDSAAVPGSNQSRASRDATSPCRNCDRRPLPQPPPASMTTRHGGAPISGTSSTTPCAPPAC